MNSNNSTAAVWVKANERLPKINAKYFCRHPKTMVRMYIWNHEIYSQLEWLDESGVNDGEQKNNSDDGHKNNLGGND